MANKLIDKINDGTNKWWIDKGIYVLGNYWDSAGSYTFDTSTHKLIVHINCTYEGPDIPNTSILSVYLPELADIDGSFTPSSTSYIVDRYLFLDVYLEGNVPGPNSTPDLIVLVDNSLMPYHHKLDDSTQYYELIGVGGEVLVWYEEESDTVEGVSIDGSVYSAISIGNSSGDIGIPSLWTPSELYNLINSAGGYTKVERIEYESKTYAQITSMLSQGIFPIVEITENSKVYEYYFAGLTELGYIFTCVSTGSYGSFVNWCTVSSSNNWDSGGDLVSGDVTSGMGITTTSNTFDIIMSNYDGDQVYRLFTFVVSSSKSIYPTIEINTLRSSGLANNRITVQRSNTTLDGVAAPTTIPAGVYQGSLSAWSNSATLTITSFKTDATQVQIVRW